MAGRWRIISHPHREWIIEADGARCAVGADLGRVLLPLAGQAPDQERIRRQLEQGAWPPGREAAPEISQGLYHLLQRRPAGRGGPARRSVWLRVPLVPGRITRWLAGQLAWLTWAPLLAGMALLGAGLYLVAASRASLAVAPAAGQVLPGLGLFLALALFHELGHAAALHREGYPPGGIGLGVLFVVPVLFADVSAVAALPRRGKLRVDLAGVCFQLAAGALVFTAGALNPHLPGAAVCKLAGLLVLPAVAWSLLPFIRADGYWFLADLLGLPDLDRPAPPGAGRRLRLFLVLHRAGNAAFLILIGVLLPWRLHRHAVWLAGGLGVPAWPATLVTVAFSLAAWWGLGHRLVMLVSASRRDIQGCSHTDPGR